MIVALTLLALLPALVTAFLLGRHFQRRRDAGRELSPVTRQHIELFQGGHLNQAAVEAAKARFRELLERGEVAAVEASLRPGMHYVIHVRALAEIGTDDAGRILERQLNRRLTDDAIEQSWYWIDLANSLRAINREQSLPHLLRCAEAAGDIPLGQFFAAETVSFLGFAGYLRQSDFFLRDAALRLLHRALEGLRCGIQPHLVAEARLGELIEILWDNRPDSVHPLVVRVFFEALRLLRRAPHAELAMADDRAEQEAFTWQISRLAALEPVLEDYLHEAPTFLAAALPRAGEAEQREILLALYDLRADAAAAILPLLAKPSWSQAELAVLALTWSREPQVGPFLRSWAGRRIPLTRRTRSLRRASAPRRSSVPEDVPYRAILRALRGHASPETESFLLLASIDWDPTYRLAAISSLGWWEPFRRSRVLPCLQNARRDPNPEVREMARAALARLGERQALQSLRHRLVGEDTQRIHETLQLVAGEAVMLLWPDLDRLADAEDTDIAYHAREALERLREELNVGPA
jgi:hypothetical protein